MDTNKLAYQSQRERFDDMCKFIHALALRYMRCYQSSLISDEQEFTPSIINSKEILSLSDIKPDETASSEWLDLHNFPSHDEILKKIKKLNQQIDSRIEATYISNHPEYLTPETIQAQFQLSSNEILLLCAIAAAQVNDDINREYKYITGSPLTIFPGSFYTKLLANAQLTEYDILQMLAPEKPLRMLSLVETGNMDGWGNETPILHAPLKVPNRIASFLIGMEENAEVAHASFFQADQESKKELVIPDSFKKTVTRALRKVKPRIGLYGPRGFGRRSWMRDFASNQNLSVVEIDLTSLQAEESSDQILALAQLWFREARLRQALMLFRCDVDYSEDLKKKLDPIAPKFKNILKEHPGTICLTASKPTPWIRNLFGEHTEILCPEIKRQEQPALWKRSLSKYLKDDVLENTVDYVSAAYILTPGEIEDTVQACIARVGENALSGKSLLETLRTSRGHELEGLAELKATPLGLNDIILSPDALSTINEILNFSRYSDVVRNDWGFAKVSAGGGLSVLFSGPPGTGKTLTAGVLAHELRRALYVIDLSRVVDKYIGETEKRLAKIFDHAQASQAILLFDEADSLFAKRTSVKSSNDRYANLEVNYLLQKLETYNGISILTTNLADSLDEALARRIQFKIAFPMPNRDDRMRLWQFLLPKPAYKSEIDFETLGEFFEMSGGHIKNAVFRACIEAASHHISVTTEMLWKAAIHEYREMGHVIKDTAYRPIHHQSKTYSD